MSNCTSSTGMPGPALTLKALEEALRKIEPDPFGAWMRAQNFAPEDGGLLILPVQMREHLPDPPRYVRFSAVVAAPMLVRDVFGLNADTP